ncbi:hypothetical protein [Alteromonas flava]|uniref:hypothetical protein n=1 Tax=Alteromonas flava TaxID=2048003 RepID=UPI000C28E386|nr:hypothetical protein [Alteromonas flava]
MRTATIFILVFAVISVQAKTLQTSPDQLTLLHNRAKIQLPNDTALQSGDWYASLDGLKQPQQVMQIQLWLEQLANNSVPSVAQRQWVASMSTDTRELVIANPDHPHAYLSVANLAKQAKAAQYIWQVNSLKAMLEHDWQRGRFSWQELLVNPASAQTDALVQWINSLSIAEAQAVALHFENYGLDYIEGSNRILATVALRGGSSFLTEKLLQRTPDQYSYWFIQQSGNFFTDYEHISQLGLALSNPALSSQALNLLAKKYSMDRQAQEHLEQAIKNPDLQWQAVAALAFMPENSFRSVLVEQIEHYNLPSKILLERLPSEGAAR